LAELRAFVALAIGRCSLSAIAPTPPAASGCLVLVSAIDRAWCVCVCGDRRRDLGCSMALCGAWRRAQGGGDRSVRGCLVLASASAPGGANVRQRSRDQAAARGRPRVGGVMRILVRCCGLSSDPRGMSEIPSDGERLN
jgi:hypothetical protein